MNVNGSMFGSLDISISGLKAYGKQMEVISSNVANARTTDAGNGQPYRRIEAIFKSQKDGIGGVEISELFEDTGDFQKILATPGDPRADDNGYISMPNINMANEVINLNLASRAYQANAAILKRYQAMVKTSLDLLQA
jgi:flagellar basal-body rod protein FlgC